MLFYTATIFLSAFLLFAVQPIIAKMILPWFGGTSAVWSTCLLFFQLVLLFGYLYAHWLHRRFSPRRQAMIHSVLLGLSLAALPIVPGDRWKSAAVGQPSLRILTLLAVTVGLPYWLLSSTSPLLQSWYARTHKAGLPYRLFALSNFASMLALLSYPALIEPFLTARLQAWIWSGAYLGFTLVCAGTAWRSSRGMSMVEAVEEPAAVEREPDALRRLLWLGLAASASVLLLAVTTHLTQDVAPIPFLWILPLAVYLLTFILCFDAPWYYHRAVFLPLLLAALAYMAFELWPGHTNLHEGWLGELAHLRIRGLIVTFAGSLFVACMVCHGELARLKPHPRYLTSFFVTISLGGALGGVFVGLVAPNFFRAYYELPIGLALTALMAALVYGRELRPTGRWKRIGGIAALAGILCGYGFCLVRVMNQMVDGYRVVVRNFYGQLRVYDYTDAGSDAGPARTLVHGTINHGQQMLRDEYRRQPVTYFCPPSGIGRAMQVTEGPPRRIGVLGLGCGTLAAYGREGDTIRIYEINPLVLEVARSEFTYLADTAAKVEVAMGDGRLVLDSEPDQQFDVLVMDAFSGDSVPVHLITIEAFRTYFRHLKPDGILAVNITNQYLDLAPVVERAAHTLGKTAMAYYWDPPIDDFLCFSSSWALIMSPEKLATRPALAEGGVVLKAGRAFRTWTDDFSNMWSILK